MIKPVIKNVSYYVPTNEINNDYFIDLYNKIGTDVKGLLNATGRKIRRVCDDNETILTMALKASKDAIKKANITEEDIDMIVFSTGTPEYIQPCNAIKLHNELNCKKEVMLYDINASCVGMIVALTQISSIMKNNSKIKYALLVGAEQFFSYTNKDMVIPYTNFGESSCAVILENIEITEERGLIDYSFYTDSTGQSDIELPYCGMKKALTTNVDVNKKMVSWVPFDPNSAFKVAVNSIKKLLDENGIPKEKVKKFFLSQFGFAGIKLIADELKEDIDKFKFIGDKYGYTGTTSPFIALAESFNDNELNKGDVVIFWSVGSGYTCHTTLYVL